MKGECKKEGDTIDCTYEDIRKGYCLVVDAPLFCTDAFVAAVPAHPEADGCTADDIARGHIGQAAISRVFPLESKHAETHNRADGAVLCSEQ